MLVEHSNHDCRAPRHAGVTLGDLFRVDAASVKLRVRILIGPERGAGERNAGKYATRAGIGEDFRAHIGVRVGSRIAADRPGGAHPAWGTLVFNNGRHEVRNFLVANALFWLREYHADGIRDDAVASMLYLDYSREEGQWVPNQYGGNEDLGAVAFLKELNEVLFGREPGVVTAAEESTAWPGVSRPTYLGGLGFGFKWNMGWMHDTLEYFQREPVHRRYHHHTLTFSLLYAFSENFVLPLSHDEVVHGKHSLLGRMPGDDWQRFANLRVLLGYQWLFPGKKLLFMGGEFGQPDEWDANKQLQWHLLKSGPYHRGLQQFIEDLNKLYQLGFRAGFPGSVLEDGVYYGVRVRGRLVSAAGADPDRLAAEIAALDAAFEARGGATAAERAAYERRRAELKARLEELLARLPA